MKFFFIFRNRKNFAILFSYDIYKRIWELTSAEEVFFYHMKNEMAKIFRFWNMKKNSYLKYEKYHLQICLEFYISLIKNKVLPTFKINSKRSDQEKYHFCGQYWKIYANEIFYISNMNFFSYFKMEKILPFHFSYDRKNLFSRTLKINLQIVYRLQR